MIVYFLFSWKLDISPFSCYYYQPILVNITIAHSQLLKLEDMACYAGLLLDPAEDFGLWPRLCLPFGQKWLTNLKISKNLKKSQKIKSNIGRM